MASTAIADEPPSSVAILVYHRFDPAAPGPMTVHTSVFAEQLGWLAEHRVRVVPLRTLVESLQRGELPANLPAVALTADDGHRSVFSEMYPLIRRYGVPVTLFIYPSAISNADYALTWNQLDEMIKSGLVEVQSHTYWHPDFRIEKRRLAPDAYDALVRSQLALSKSRIEERLAVRVDLLAWPFGLYDSELERRASEEGYIAAFSLDRRPVRVGADLFALPRYLVTDGDRGPRFAALVSGAAEKAPQ